MSMKGLTYGLIAAGLLDSGYLLYLSTQPVCPLGVCASISIFSLPQYIPALLGLVWFALSFIIFTFKIPVVVLQLWRFSGVAGASFLGTYALLNNYYCPFCFAAYILGILLILISEREFDY
ncbi:MULTISPECIES: hypothetical protein [unclassified Archaeoglobus]|uniref:hypothetical protein n=1 Tax=unclassified Archaeoglobus TaxID=2643606 RepID=UPI0025C483B4|nr:MULTISPECIES: hypothetical protein [unclassified Archaeoglobus]